METANLILSREVVRFLKNAHVKNVVLCSGSRNAPLIFSLQNNFEIFHHVDERSAAFFALGMSMKERKATAIVCTSGTAVAEMLPAAIEAYYQKLPLIFVSADRPESFRGTGAPQSIEQVGIFSHYAKCFDVKTPKDFPKELSFPLHLNVCLEEPMAGDWDHVQQKGESFVLNQASLSEIPEIGDLDNLLVVVGSLSPTEGRDVSAFLAQLKAPILADTTSNLQEVCSSYVLKCGERVLKKYKPQNVLRIGSVPSFRFWRDLEKLSIQVTSLCREGFSGLSRKSKVVTLDAFDSLKNLELESTGEFASLAFDLDREYVLKLKQLLEKYPESEVGYLSRLSKFVSKESLLYLGNSLPIREWNLVNGVHPCAYANRGANGIDGQVSTFLGLADSSLEAWAVVGDQTALYDLNALALSNQKSRKTPKSKRRIVVVNNGGGKIFSHLSYSSSLEHEQRKLIENQHRWEFRAWAEMFGWAYESWQEGSALLNTECDDIVLEIFPNASQSHHFWLEWRS